MFNSGQFADKVIEVSIPLVMTDARSQIEDETVSSGSKKHRANLSPSKLKLSSLECKQKAQFMLTESEQLDSEGNPDEAG